MYSFNCINSIFFLLALLDSEEINETIKSILKGKPIYKQIIDLLYVLSFLPGFTLCQIDESEEEINAMNEFPLHYCWSTGVKVNEVKLKNSTSKLDKNRWDVLACFIAALSSPIYMKPDNVVNKDEVNYFLQYMATEKNKYTHAFFISVVNVVMRYDPVGMGVPYNYLVSRSAPEHLMNISIDLLMVLLEYKWKQDFQPLQYEQIYGYGSKEPEYDQENIFIKIFFELETEDNQFMYRSITKILSSHTQYYQSILPSSTKNVNSYDDALLLLYLFSLIRRKFILDAMELPDFIDTFYHILNIINHSSQDVKHVTSVHIGLSLFLLLSGERDFSLSLNKKFFYKLPTNFPAFTGKFSDYMIISLCNLIESESEELVSFREIALTIIANLSPYIKSTSALTATKLLSVYELVSNKEYLMKDVNHQKQVVLILDTFKNFLQYQYDGNFHVFHSILKHKDSFFELNDKITLLRKIKLKQLETRNVPIREMEEFELNEGEEEMFFNNQLEDSFKLYNASSEDIVQFIKAVSLRIKKFDDEIESVRDTKIVTYLSNTTSVGIYGILKPIYIRMYKSTNENLVWIFTTLWSYVYIRSDSFLFNRPQLFKLGKSEEQQEDENEDEMEISPENNESDVEDEQNDEDVIEEKDNKDEDENENEEKEVEEVNEQKEVVEPKKEIDIIEETNDKEVKEDNNEEVEEKIEEVNQNETEEQLEASKNEEVEDNLQSGEKVDESINAEAEDNINMEVKEEFKEENQVNEDKLEGGQIEDESHNTTEQGEESVNNETENKNNEEEIENAEESNNIEEKVDELNE